MCPSKPTCAPLTTSVAPSTPRRGGLGGLDVLVNNAGVFVSHPPTSTTYEDWQAVWADTLGINLVGAANATFCAIPHLIAAGGGAIVNVSSRGAFRGEPKHARVRRVEGGPERVRPVDGQGASPACD